jgi:ketosteroid isomerase-like protein
MAEENSHVERLREVYGRWGEGDITRTDVFDPDIEVIWSPDMPDADIDRGVEALEATMERTAEAFEDMRIRATGFHSKGEKVVVFVEWSGTGRATGIPTVTPGSHVWTFAGERAIRIEGFFNHADGLRAVGIDPES